MQRHVIFIQTSWCRCRSSDSMRIHLRYVCHTQKKLASHRLLLPATFRTENSLLCCCGECDSSIWNICFCALRIIWSMASFMLFIIMAGWHIFLLKIVHLWRFVKMEKNTKKKNITRPMQWKAVTLSALIRDEWRVSRPSCRVSMRLTGMRALVLLFACGMFLFSFGCSSCWRCAASFACWGAFDMHYTAVYSFKSNRIYRVCCKCLGHQIQHEWICCFFSVEQQQRQHKLYITFHRPSRI